jgi:hypothetical protein
MTARKSHLPQVNFYSFSGDPRPSTICKTENMSSGEGQTNPTDEGFSVLMSALRRTQIGQAAQTFASGRKFPAGMNRTKG